MHGNAAIRRPPSPRPIHPARPAAALLLCAILPLAAQAQTPDPRRADAGLYERGGSEALSGLARRHQAAGDHRGALALWRRAWRAGRISHGLYHASQLPIIDGIIASGAAAEDWEAVDDGYAYMEHLHRRLYRPDDPRLDAGLKRVAAWHVRAFNADLDGRRKQHLRQARRIFKQRLEIAGRALPEDAPERAALADGVEFSERRLLLMSDRRMEALRDRGRERRTRLLAGLE